MGAWVLAGLNAADWALGALLAFGSTSIGALGLRVGFPGVLALQRTARAGAGILAGLVFSVLVIATALALHAFNPGMPFQFFLFLQACMVLLIGTMAMGLKHVALHRATRSIRSLPTASGEGLSGSLVEEWPEKPWHAHSTVKEFLQENQNADLQEKPALPVPESREPAWALEGEKVLRPESVNGTFTTPASRAPSMGDVRKALQELREQVKAKHENAEED